eukprot:CAMPEP_0178989836 /NCGR_PEP_ID=MMETSP0795-20121207/4599_1 /TAXON_ID=88552 /ORGANISM="Amoebophrya sp., Strain Ameob2" /LENGTH=1327 /DNA_ID=CAMNT_0020681289 /DNA_START=13 /DNA_END=3996 /DNA_ORIENTATION=+
MSLAGSATTAGAGGSFPLLDPVQSRNRILALHELRVAADLDALLIVLGSDARRHRGSELAFMWAVMGKSGADLFLDELEFDEICPFRGAASTIAPRKEIMKSGFYNLAEAAKIGMRSPNKKSEKAAAVTTSSSGAEIEDPWAGFAEQFGDHLSDSDEDEQVYLGETACGIDQPPSSVDALPSAFGCRSDWDEVFVVLHKFRSYVFVPNHTIKEQMWRVCCLWPNVEIHCVADGRWNPRLERTNAAFLEDPKQWREKRLGDDYDLVKIKCFIEAMNYPNGFPGEGPAGPVGKTKEAYTRGLGVFGKDVEQWPLVQAYALDDFGSHGFLTMKKAVKNLETELERVFSVVDSAFFFAPSSTWGGSVKAIQDAFVEAINNEHNRDACEQLAEYGQMSREEALELLPERSQCEVLAEFSKTKFSISASFGFSLHEVVCPKFGTYFARTVPAVAGSAQTPTLLADIVIAKHCVDAFIVSHGVDEGPQGGGMNLVREVFPIFEYIEAEKRARKGGSSRVSVLAEQYREWISNKLGEHVAKRVTGVAIDAVDVFGCSSVSGKNLETGGGVKFESGSAVVLLRVEVGAGSAAVVWGDSFLVTRPGPREFHAAAASITGGVVYPSPFALPSKIVANPAGADAEDKENTNAAADPGAMVASTTENVTIALLLPTEVLTKVSAKADWTMDLKSVGGESGKMSSTTSLLFLGSRFTDTKKNASSLTLYEKKDSSSFSLKYFSRDHLSSELWLQPSEGAGAVEIAGAVYCFCTSPPCSSGQDHEETATNFFVRIPKSWLSTMQLRIDSKASDYEPAVLANLKSLEEQQNTRPTSTTFCSALMKTQLSLSDAHLGRLPGSSRTDVEADMALLSSRSMSTSVTSTSESASSSLVYISSLPMSAKERKWAENLAVREKKTFVSLRDSDGRTALPRDNAVILNDIGAAVELDDSFGASTSNTPVVLVADLRPAERLILNALKSKNTTKSYGIPGVLSKSVLNLGCTHALVSREIAEASPFAAQFVEDFVRSVNPGVVIYQADDYFSSSVLFQGDVAVSSGGKGAIPPQSATSRLIAEPKLWTNLFEKKVLRAVTIDVEKRLFDAEKLAVAMAAEFEKTSCLVSVELQNVLVAKVNYAKQEPPSLSTIGNVMLRPDGRDFVKEIDSGTVAGTARSTDTGSSQITFYVFSTVDENARTFPVDGDLQAYFTDVLLREAPPSSGNTTSCCLLSIGAKQVTFPTEEEMHRVGQSGRVALPDGYWFDGDYYVNFQGVRQKRHPLWDDIVRGELQERELWAQKWNEVVTGFLTGFGLKLVYGGSAAAPAAHAGGKGAGAGGSMPGIAQVQGA